MGNIQKTLKAIPVHIKRWNSFALIAPPIFLSVEVFLLLSDMVEFGLLFWAGIVLMSVTAFFWWIWIILTILHLTNQLWITHNNLEIAINELTDIKKELNKTDGL